MTKRKAFFKVLKERLSNFVGTDAYYTSIWVTAFIVIFLIIFPLIKGKPIALTDDEIEYYTSQTEILRYKGQLYVDKYMRFNIKNDGSINVYNYNDPDIKDKLNVSFSDDGVPTTTTYSNHDFIVEPFGASFVFSLLGSIVFILIFAFVEWLVKQIVEKIADFKYDVNIELQDYNSENDCDCPLYFSDEDE